GDDDVVHLAYRLMIFVEYGLAQDLLLGAPSQGDLLHFSYRNSRGRGTGDLSERAARADHADTDQSAHHQSLHHQISLDSQSGNTPCECDITLASDHDLASV